MSAYYNENDPFAAAWLRELIERNLIAPGVVDERDIRDVRPIDLRGFTQCHFFAGIGVWSYALRQAGWPDDRPVWTGSCPCQPFSSAGKGDGFADERHLWPAWHWLIEQCRPPVIFGEQVASKDAEAWIDLVHVDVEALDYAFGCVPFPAAGIGAPHIRDRVYWVGYALGARLEGHSGDVNDRDESGRFDSQPRGSVAEASAASRVGEPDCGGREGRGLHVPERQSREEEPVSRRDGEVGGLAYADSGKRNGVAVIRGTERDRTNARWAEGCGEFEPRSEVNGMADDAGDGRGQKRTNARGHPVRDRAQGITAGSVTSGGDLRAGPVNGFWRDADWLFCRDEKFRPVEPGTFPLVDGAPARVGRLRGYGNAINAEAAKAFIEVANEYL